MRLHATPADVARFMRYVEKLPCGCWFWTGARSRGRGNKKWYGSFRLGKRTVRAHRFACDVIGGVDCPAGFHRDHSCCFSLCVNPSHLVVMTREENQRLKVERRARLHATLTDGSLARGLSQLARAM